MFKHAQETWCLQSVIDMTDEQYTQALDAAHEDLVNHVSQRVAMKCQRNQGLEDVKVRDTAEA